MDAHCDLDWPRLRASALTALALLWFLPAASWAQPTLDPAQPQGSSKLQSDPLVSAEGPWAGLVYDMTYGPGRNGQDPFVLTESGIYRYDPSDRAWIHQVVLPPETPLARMPPFIVDPVHAIDGLSAYQGFYGPQDVKLLVSARAFFVINQRGEVFKAVRGGGSWKLLDRTKTEGALKGSQRRLSAALGRMDVDQLFMLDARRSAEGTESSQIWRRDSDKDAWLLQDWPERSVLINTGRAATGVSWRYTGLTPSIKEGEDRYQVSRFLRLRLAPGQNVRFQEIDWAAYLRSEREQVRKGCRGATGMLEAQTPAGDGEPPLMVAIGPRTLCVSSDGGASFAVRDGLMRGATPRDKIGDLISAVAFAHKDARSGVRILVGTDGVFNVESPGSRAYAGRLFLSDDAGVSWQDVTPEIEAPGGFIGLSAGPSLQDRPVWLLTARRGLYKSVGGLGFTRVSTGIEATLVHAIAPDPVTPADVWVASPYGLFKRGSNWVRDKVTATRSVASRYATNKHLGQLWVGTYWGVVLVKGQGSGLEAENLPPVPEGGQRPLPIEVTQGNFERPVPVATGIRPVAMVVPAGFDENMQDTGYAIEEGELAAIHRREGGRWVRLERPSQAPLRINDMIAVPVTAGSFGALVLGTEMRGSEKVKGKVWLHVPGKGWLKAEVPGGDVPVAAVALRDRVWISTTTGALLPLAITDTKMVFGKPISSRHQCLSLTLRRDNKVSCLMPGHDGVSDGVEPSVKKRRPIAKALIMSVDALKPGKRLPADQIERWRYEAPNPLGRPFGEPLAAAFSSVTAVGEHMWISTGLGIYTRPAALSGQLPPEIEVADDGPSWVMPLVLTIIVAIGGIFVLVWLRRRRLAGRALGALSR